MSQCFNRHHDYRPAVPAYNFADIVNFGGNQGQPVPEHYVHGLTHTPPEWVTRSYPRWSLQSVDYKQSASGPVQRSDLSWQQDGQFLFGLNNRNPRQGPRS